MAEPDSQAIVGAFWYGGRVYKLRTAAGVERLVKRDEFEAEFARLYPGKRLPWDGGLPTHAVIE